MKTSLVSLILPTFLITVVSSKILNTRYGALTGFDYQTESGRLAEIFLGIPYARPPVNNLKFERPVAINPWRGVLNASRFPSSCAVHDPIFAANASEDCLYLNVYRPKWKSPSPNGHPIVVWIHGGGWMMGDTEYYGYKAISDNFIPQGIIVISIQYRLGPWGFFSTGDSRLPGNLGLWDQVQALKFINQVARDFGGDPKRVTLMGQSAGSASISWLSLTAQTDGLFQQSIQFSGSAYGAWSRSNQVVDFSANLAKDLGCDFSSRNLKACLKKFSIKDIQKKTSGIGLFNQDINFAYMNPRIDGQFLRGFNFDDSIKKAPRRPTLISVTSQDSLFWSYEQLGLMPAEELYNLPDEEVQSYSRAKLVSFIKKNVATKERFGPRAQEAANEIISHYADLKVPARPDNLFYFERFTQLLSDLHFNLPAVREARLKAIAGYPVFFQVYSYEKGLEFTEYPIHGTPHGAELYPLFKTFVYAGFEEVPEDEKIRKTFVEFLASFIRTGNPSTKRIRIPTLTKSRFPYLDLNLSPTIRQNPFESHYIFWERMVRKYMFDVSKGISMRQFLVKASKQPRELVPFRQLAQ
ncbi:hypothetical protein FO519_008965 [Halicephalobus sp. NKZ332]|nr:hypothetical protein FO519_008965 [Halicephalobus sp. NKZ332]